MQPPADAAGLPPTTGFDLCETMVFDPNVGFPLIAEHLSRLCASAEELGFACDVHGLRNVIQSLCFRTEEPSRLRLHLARSGAFTLELTAMPTALPEPAPCVVLPLPVAADDWRLRYKSSDRSFYEAGLQVAHSVGASEALFIRDDGLLTEGCFTNIFVPGAGGIWLTPPARLGLLPGVLRASLLGDGRAREAELRLADLADGFAIGNALRGLSPACLLANDA